jgi:hypothetical protein
MRQKAFAWCLLKDTMNKKKKMMSKGEALGTKTKTMNKAVIFV